MDSAPTSPTDVEGDGRKRVCKACDRCRIKKSKVTPASATQKSSTNYPTSKCDGKKPCGRCRNDDAICVFGGRKRKHDRVHPKGYVEILERQQRQLVRGIRALYDRQLSAQPWTGPLPHKGYPSTHDILEYLGALELEDSSGDEACEDQSHFEENFHDLRQSVVKKDKDGTQAQSSTNSVSSPTQGPLGQEHSQGYFSNEQALSMSPLSTPPDLSPSDQTSLTSPATSTTTEHWSTKDWPAPFPQQQIPLEPVAKSLDPPEGLSIHYRSGYAGIPMQNPFDPYLVPPWEPDEELNGFAYAS
ncbi:MAG: hypothetical protein Q9217_000254 [Psora testacea]